MLWAPEALDFDLDMRAVRKGCLECLSRGNACGASPIEIARAVDAPDFATWRCWSGLITRLSTVVQDLEFHAPYCRGVFAGTQSKSMLKGFRACQLFWRCNKVCREQVVEMNSS